MTLFTFPRINQPKNYFTLFTCKRCSQALSLESAFEFQHPLAGREMRLLDGIYCADCHETLVLQFSSNRQGSTDTCTTMYHAAKCCEACGKLGGLC